MVSKSAAVEHHPPPAVPHRQRRRKTNRRQKPKRQPPYAVVLHNDPINGFDYVIGVLKKVFGYGTPKAFWLTMKAHCTGRSIVWSGPLEVAELKAEQLRAAGPDPAQISAGAASLGVTVEALPGE